MSEKQERKTTDVVKAQDILHLYHGRPQTVYIVGDIKQKEFQKKDGSGSVYVQEFRGTYTKPEDPSVVDFKKSGLFRVATTEPFSGLAEKQKANEPVLVSGQTFKEPYKGKDGKEREMTRTHVRSIREAVFTKDENGKNRVHGGEVLMSSDIAMKGEINQVERSGLQGFINFVKLNEEIKKRDTGEVFAYKQFMLVGDKEHGNTRVQFYTTQPVDPADFEKGSRLSMLGVLMVEDVYSKKEEKWVKQVTFEPVFVSRYKDLAKDKDMDVAEVADIPSIAQTLDDMEEELDYESLVL